MSNHNLKYRPDIDGLRAIAILLVVCFHAFPDKLKNGFIGVDIFFVISGYLISTIIFKELDNGSFSFAKFYARRIRRIFPALILLLLVSLAVGYFVLFPDEYFSLNKSVFAGSAFISNFLLIKESGYFDGDSSNKIMLHLWSLSIEEQFYVFLPVFLWLLSKKKSLTLYFVAAFTIIFFVINIAYINKANSSLAFYSPQSRFWELLVGSLLSYISLHKAQFLEKASLKIIPFIGFGLIVLTLFLDIPKNEFPGWWALFPVVASVLIISDKNCWLNRVILSNKALVYIGLISFPLYLWHWPLLSFTHIYFSGLEPLSAKIASVALSILLACLTYHFIEKPIRFSKNQKITMILFLSLLALASLSYAIYGKKIANSYGDKEKSEFIKFFENEYPGLHYLKNNNILQEYRDDCNFHDIEKWRIDKSERRPLQSINKSCFTKQHLNKKTLFIWGDSHAQQLYSGLKSNMPKNWEILIVASSGCNPKIITKDSKLDYCERSNWAALEAIKKIKPEAIIVAQKSGHDYEVMVKLFSDLQKYRLGKVFFTGPVPKWKTDLPRLVVRRLWQEKSERSFVGIDKEVFVKNSSLVSQFLNTKIKNLFFLNLMKSFCDDEGCLTRVGDDKKLGIVSWDYGHLTPVASSYLAKKLLVENILKNQ